MHGARTGLAIAGTAALALGVFAGCGDETPMQPPRQETVSLQSVRDNTLFEYATGDSSSGAGPSFFVGLNSQGRIRRGLLAFAIAESIPAGARIDSVRLQLYCSNASSATPRAISLLRASRSWGEGSSSSTGGSGAPATPGDATWTCRFYPDSLWTTPGGDFDASSLHATTSVADVGFYEWSAAAMTADVQAWLDHPSTDVGWLVQGEEAVPGSARRFESRENATPDRRPLLRVYYTIR
jgi:hypothetical protein